MLIIKYFFVELKCHYVNCRDQCICTYTVYEYIPSRSQAREVSSYSVLYSFGIRMMADL